MNACDFNSVQHLQAHRKIYNVDEIDVLGQDDVACCCRQRVILIMIQANFYKWKRLRKT